MCDVFRHRARHLYINDSNAVCPATSILIWPFRHTMYDTHYKTIAAHYGTYESLKHIATATTQTTSLAFDSLYAMSTSMHNVLWCAEGVVLGDKTKLLLHYICGIYTCRWVANVYATLNICVWYSAYCKARDVGGSLAFLLFGH